MADVLMPQMGESIVEGTLTRWLKKLGDHVERDEPLFEISTDKVDTEIPAPVAGTLSEILVQEGATVGINTIVARIGAPAGDGSAAPAAPAAEAAQPPAPAPAPVAAPVPAPVPAAPAEPPAPAPPAPQAIEEPEAEFAGPVSPLVRKLVRENNIDLRQVKGTGAGGRVTKSDVDAYLASRVTTAAAPAWTAPALSAAAPAVPAAPASLPPLARVDPAKVRVEPMSMMRQKIAEHMVHSKQTSAHVTTVHRVDMTKVAKLRARVKAEFQQRYGFGLTFLPFVARAAAEALRTFPLLNASIEGTNILYHNEVNLGIAVALDNGLIVPVIRQADEKNIVGLQRSIVDLAARARGKQLKPDEVSGGTFSITNFGSFGSLFATPVINQPQIAILGVGAVEKVPVVIEGDAIAIRSMAYLALTFDHRLVDGALADQFCQKVKQVLEGWSDEIL
jgi:pyruvate dehydrogenase E2 component (dihydrolipoamide acetyltransferase)